MAVVVADADPAVVVIEALVACMELRDDKLEVRVEEDCVVKVLLLAELVIVVEALALMRKGEVLYSAPD